MTESVYDQVEIEDMEFVKEQNKFFYPCPCGDRFEISVEELLDGEDIARCPSCSLILRVIKISTVMLEHEVSPTVLSALVSGCLKIHILEDSRLDMTRLLEIVSSIEGGPSEEEILVLASKDSFITNLLQKAAMHRWNVAQFESALKEAGVDQNLIESFSNVWRKEEAKVAAHLRDKSFWGPKLQKLSWRVDICTRSAHVSEINEPCAVMEMTIANPRTGPQVLRFEVDKDTLSDMNAQVRRLQQALQGAAS